MLDVATTVDVAAPRCKVWELVHSPENAILLDPRVVRGFRSAGIPEGPGEIHVLILKVNGRERVSAFEIVDWSPTDFAVARELGDGDGAGRHAYRLTDIAGGTRLEYRTVFSVPASDSERVHREDRRDLLQGYLDRVKLLAEGGWRAPGASSAP